MGHNRILEKSGAIGQKLMAHVPLTGTRKGLAIGMASLATFVLPGAALAVGNPNTDELAGSQSVPATSSEQSDNSTHQSSPGSDNQAEISQQGVSLKVEANPKSQSTTVGPNASVTVNGTPVPIPKNGVISKEITNNGGTTNLHISVGGASQSYSSNNSTSIEVYSHSSSSQPQPESSDPRSLPRR